MAIKRWMYRGGRPNQLTKIINAGWAILHTLGLYPNRFVTLEVVGRQSGKTISFPLAMTVMNGGDTSCPCWERKRTGCETSRRQAEKRGSDTESASKFS